MCTVFWDKEAVLLVDFLLRGEIVNTEKYFETLKKLHQAIHNRR